MTGKLILDAVGGISDRYIMEFVDVTQKKRINWKPAALAACLCLALTAVLLWSNGTRRGTTPTIAYEDVIWGENIEDMEASNYGDVKPGHICISEGLQNAFDRSNDARDVFAIRVIELTGASEEQVYEEFIKDLGDYEEYLSRGMIFATQEQVREILVSDRFAIVFELASKPSDTTPVGADYVFPSGCKIYGNLVDKLAEATDDELLPVVIRIRDNVDLATVEELAMERAGVSAEDLLFYENQTRILSDAENLVFQRDVVMPAYDRIRHERVTILGEYYQQLNEGFLVNTGLSDAQYESVSTLLPCILGIRLTKGQIYQLASDPQVSWMDYYEDSAAEDLGG